MHHRRRTCCAIGAAAMLAAASASAAQDNGAASYPGKPIRWIVPFPPGGAADIVSRAVAQKLSERWGQQVVVDNRAGAGGNLGTELAAHAPADGYTVVIVPATFTSNPALHSDLGYDPVKSFAPITLVSSSALVLVVHPSLPVRSVGDLVALAKAKPGELNYASSGIGASAHLAAELFQHYAHVKMVHVPYKGQPPALVDLIGGQVQVMFPNIPASLPHVKAKRLRAIAVTTSKRAALFPQLQTIAESGMAGFEVNQWSGLVAPSGTAPAVVRKFRDEVSRALREPEVKASLMAQGFEPVGSTTAEFARYIDAEITKWSALIRSAGIKAD